jgi:aminoglycoside phosphotransferase (APT) family kinase protein
VSSAPTKNDPQKTDPAKNDPAKNDPAKNDPANRLEAQLQRLLDGEIRDLRRLTGGASRETWSFDCRRADRNNVWEELILRRDPIGLVAGAGRSGGMLLEAQLFGAAASAGIPVPRIVASGEADHDVLDSGFLIMTRVAGETIARKILRDEPYAHARAVLVRQLGDALARLHGVPTESIPDLDALDRMGRYRDVLDALEYSSPTFEFAFRWLAEHQQRKPRSTVVHGDFRLGNVIVDENGLAAVLDWELAHIGDPMEDLGWLCVRAWRFGGSGAVAGIGELDELFAGYRAAGGEVDPEAVRWWIVAGTLVWGVMCALQASAHTSGAMPSVELAAIGRRVAEQEHDLLVLLGAPPADPEVVQAAQSITKRPVPNPNLDPNAAAGSSVRSVTSEFGVPDLVGLLDAVKMYIDHDVFGSTTGRVQFHARVASNALATAQREIRLGAKAQQAFERCYARFGVGSEVELATKVRSGTLEHHDELLESLREVVTYRLAVANPKHFEAVTGSG